LANLHYPLRRLLLDRLIVERVKEDVQPLLRVVDDLGLLRLRTCLFRQQTLEEAEAKKGEGRGRTGVIDLNLLSSPWRTSKIERY